MSERRIASPTPQPDALLPDAPAIVFVVTFIDRSTAQQRDTTT